MKSQDSSKSVCAEIPSEAAGLALVFPWFTGLPGECMGIGSYRTGRGPGPGRGYDSCLVFGGWRGCRPCSPPAGNRKLIYINDTHKKNMAITTHKPAAHGIGKAPVLTEGVD